jgi:hypothetical protein
LNLDSEDARPNADIALTRLRTRRFEAKRRRNILLWSCLPLCAVLLPILTAPSTRAVAQCLLVRFSAVRFDVLPVGLDELNNLPSSVRSVLVNPAPAHTPVADLAEAVRQAGFIPRLPQSDGLGNSLPAPGLSVVASIHKESKIRVDELQTALARSGSAEITVPQNWDGAVIEIDESAGIAASYGQIYLAQRLPLKLDAPPGFPVDQSLEVLFRIAGINFADAASLRRKFGANPADFLLVAPRYHLNPHEVQLASGSGLLLEHFRGEQIPGEGLMLIWSTSDRCFFLSGTLTEAQAIAIANSIS